MLSPYTQTLLKKTKEVKKGTEANYSTTKLIATLGDKVKQFLEFS